MKKSGELLKVGIVILLAGTIAAGIHIYRNYENHRFDKYLASPEDAVEQCIKERNWIRKEYISPGCEYIQIRKAERKERRCGAGGAGESV